MRILLCRRVPPQTGGGLRTPIRPPTETIAVLRPTGFQPTSSVAELSAFGDDFSSDLLTCSNEAELELRPEVVCARSKRRFDPDLTSNGCRTTSDRVGIPPRNGGNALGGFLRLVAEYVSYFALRTTDGRNYTVPVPPIAGARRQCLIDDRSPSVEIPGSANQVDLVEAAPQKSEAATEARTTAWSIRARSKLGRCGCARFPANRLQARIW